MRLFVVSDSHGDTYTLKMILSRACGFDTIVHLGDGASDLMGMTEYTYGKKIIAVRGNCDSAAYGYPDRDSFFIDEKKVFLCHGHAYGVKFGLTNLYLAAKESGASLCLFGHTHQPFSETHDDICFFNPGSAKNGMYGIVESAGGNFYAVNLKL